MSNDAPGEAVTAGYAALGRGGGSSQPPSAADLYCDLEAPAASRLRDYWPGLAVTGLAVLAATFVSEHYGAPATLMALLIGLALNFLGADRRLHPGLSFAATRLLRFGIILLGARVTLGHIVDLGAPALLAIVAILAITMLSGILFARLLGQDAAFGALAGGAVAICGASAALALAAVFGERRIGGAQLALVLVGISTMSALAMFLYPIAAHSLGLTSQQAGFFLGASIHDVAQAIGAGYSFSDDAGQTATIVKLARVVLLAPVLAIVGLLLVRGSGPSWAVLGFPWFVLGFLGMVAVNSTGVVPLALGRGLGESGAVMVVAAVAAAGIRSPMAQILNHGAWPLLVIAAATLVAAAASLATAMLLL